MIYEPDIFISQDQSVLQRIIDRKTLAACWNAAGNREFEDIYKRVRSEHVDEDAVLDAVEATYMTGIDGIVGNLGISFSGYDPLHLWENEAGDDMSAEAVPHKDYPCLRIFFYFNEHNLSTICIPNQYAGVSAGKDFNADELFPHADFTKAVQLPPQGIAIIKLGEQVHCSPDSIPDGAVRKVMHARYSF